MSRGFCSTNAHPHLRRAGFIDPATPAGHVGLGHLSSDDIVDSRKFLRKVFRRQLEEAEAGKQKLTVAGEQPLQHLSYMVLCADNKTGKQAGGGRVQTAASVAFSFACSTAS